MIENTEVSSGLAGAGEGTLPAVPEASRAVQRLIERAVIDFNLIEAGDRVAVGVSGGKDSLLLACALHHLSRRADRPFELTLVHLDQHQPGFAREQFDATFAAVGLPVTVVSKDTWTVVASKLKPGQIPCALCGRMRRGILNKWCAEQGINKLALGHHLDDAIHTFFLNLFFQRRLDPLKAATPTEDDTVTTIRPLILVEEAPIRDWVARNTLVPVACPVCDTFPDSKRRDLHGLLDQLRAAHPGLAESVRDALYGRAETGLTVL